MRFTKSQIGAICRQRACQKKAKARKAARGETDSVDRYQVLVRVLDNCPLLTARQLGAHLCWRSRDVQAALARALDARAIIALPPSDGHPMPRYLTPAPRRIPTP